MKSWQHRSSGGAIMNNNNNTKESHHFAFQSIKRFSLALILDVNDS